MLLVVPGIAGEAASILEGPWGLGSTGLSNYMIFNSGLQDSKMASGFQDDELQCASA
jgi:hypothetical protein